MLLFNLVLPNTWSMPRTSGVLPRILHKITCFIWWWRRKQWLLFQRRKTWAEKIEILCSPEFGTELLQPRPPSWGFMILYMRGYMLNEMTFLFVYVCACLCECMCVCVAKGDGSQKPSLFIYLFVYLAIYLLFSESGPLTGLNITNQVKLSVCLSVHRGAAMHSAEITDTYHHTQHFYSHKSELLWSSPGLQEVSVFKLSSLSRPEMVFLCIICCTPSPPPVRVFFFLHFFFHGLLLFSLFVICT